MRFTLFVDSHTWLGWSDVSGQPQLFGTPELQARVRRADAFGLRIGGYKADLSVAHRAYRTMIGAIRERVGVHGPIEFTGFDDDGREITFIPEPDAESAT